MWCVCGALPATLQVFEVCREGVGLRMGGILDVGTYTVATLFLIFGIGLAWLGLWVRIVVLGRAVHTCHRVITLQQRQFYESGAASVIMLRYLAEKDPAWDTPRSREVIRDWEDRLAELKAVSTGSDNAN